MSSSEEDSGEDNTANPWTMAFADRLLEVAEHGKADQLPSGASPAGKFDGGGKFRSLEERLLELHIEESSKAGCQPSSHHLNPCSNLVSLLCRKDRCNRLLVTLLPNNEGYSVQVKISGSGGQNNGCGGVNQQPQPASNEVELFRLPYEDEDFLTYLDNEELPTSILDLLEKAWSELFYSGCVIAEIRDYRRSSTTHSAMNNEDLAGLTSHVLLRPTTQSIICDGKLICERSGWNSREERAMVESQLCLATQGPLCLDPNPVVSILAKKSCVRRQKFATPAMRRHAKMFSQAGLNRKRKLEETAAAPPELQLHDFVQKRPNHKNAQEMLQQHQAMMRANLRSIIQGQQQLPSTASTPAGSSIAGSMISPASNSNLDSLIVTDVSKHARAIQKRADVNDMTPHVVEEYILETAERGANRIYHTKLTIYQRLANEEYLGELYVERDFNERDKKGSTCRFVLGTRPHALRYINQFTEIFTEEGRKPVKITHLVPNQKPRITFTPGMRERMNERAAAVAAANAARATLTNSNAAAGSSNVNNSVNNVNSLNNGTTVSSGGNGTAVVKKQAVLSVSVPGPSILQQTLSAPSAGVVQSQVPVRAAVASVMPQSVNVGNNLQLPQTPHPPQQPQAGQQAEATPSSSETAPSSGEQEMAISAIMQSLMKDSAQFEVEAKQQSSIGLNQLPTCPVPQASLGNLCNSNSSSPVKLPQSPQSSTLLAAKRVSLKNLLSAQANANQNSEAAGSNSPIKSPVKVTMSQLAAQLSRPVTITSNLPSYTQAIAEQKGNQAISPRPRLIVTAQQPPPTASVKMEAASSPNLQALLGPPADNNVIPVELGGGNASNPSLLERLVSGQPISSSSPPVSSKMNSSASDNNEITLAALLSKPPVQNISPASGPTPSTASSPTKASPLIQQLQQPIPPPQRLPQSPRQPSPRMSTMASPRPQQPQVMQPPKIQQAQENLPNGHNGNNMVSLQNLLQSGMAVQVSQQPPTATSSIPVQFNIPGLSAPVTLSVNVQDQQQQMSTQPQQQPQQASQPQLQSQPQKLVPTSTTVMASAANPTGTVLIPQGSNIIQLPQQPINMRTQTVQLTNANNLIKGQVVQVRGHGGGQAPLYVQMPVTSAAASGSGGNAVGPQASGQSILVRQQAFNPASAASATAQPQQPQLILNSVKNQTGSLIALSQHQQLPQQPVVLQANSASAVLSTQPQPRQVAIQLQEQPMHAQAKMQVSNQRMRQQRKQSLK